MSNMDKNGLGPILRDVRVLLEDQARRLGGKLLVSPEVADLLDSICPRSALDARSAPAAREYPGPGDVRSAPAAREYPGPGDVQSAPAARKYRDAADAPSSPAALAYPDAAERLAALGAIEEEVRACTKCGLCRSRTNTVFGVGNPNAELVFVGEAPGADEDRQGMPFVGRAGQLLTDIIVKGMKRRREDVYICNVIKCRPPDNRDPSPEEVFYCEPYLLRQLEIIQPKVICALGRVAAQTLLKNTTPIGRLRGRWYAYHGIPLRVTYHPAYLLRCEPNPERFKAEKRKVWDDIKEILKVLDGDAPAIG